MFLKFLSIQLILMFCIGTSQLSSLALRSTFQPIENTSDSDIYKGKYHSKLRSRAIAYVTVRDKIEKNSWHTPLQIALFILFIPTFCILLHFFDPSFSVNKILNFIFLPLCFLISLAIVISNFIFFHKIINYKNKKDYSHYSIINIFISCVLIICILTIDAFFIFKIFKSFDGVNLIPFKIILSTLFIIFISYILFKEFIPIFILSNDDFHNPNNVWIEPSHEIKPFKGINLSLGTCMVYEDYVTQNKITEVSLPKHDANALEPTSLRYSSRSQFHYQKSTLPPSYEASVTPNSINLKSQYLSNKNLSRNS